MGRPPWTVTVFLAGDGDLAERALADERALREAAEAGRGRVAWLRDGRERSVFEAWARGRRRERVESPPVNTGNPAVLQACLQASERALGEGRRVLVLWGHGTGWVGEAPTQPQRASIFGGRGPVGGGRAQGLVTHDAGSDDWLDTRELVEVLSAECRDAPLALLGFDACYMAGVELLAALAPFAEVLVAGPDAVPGCGWDYPDLLASLQPRRSAPAIAARVVETFATRHPDAPAPLVAVSRAGILAAREALDTLGSVALEEGVGARLVTALGAGAARPYGGNACFGFDVGDVARLFDGLGSPRVAAAAAHLDAASRAAAGRPSGPATGLSVFLGDVVVGCVPPQYGDVSPPTSPWFRFLESAWGPAPRRPS